jgi:hypothetical protein
VKDLKENLANLLLDKIKIVAGGEKKQTVMHYI